jgi:hypothetical protein
MAMVAEAMAMAVMAMVAARTFRPLFIFKKCDRKIEIINFIYVF